MFGGGKKKPAKSAGARPKNNDLANMVILIKFYIDSFIFFIQFEDGMDYFMISVNLLKLKF